MLFLHKMFKTNTHVQIQIKETPLLSSGEQSEHLLGPLSKNALFNQSFTSHYTKKKCLNVIKTMYICSTLP